MEELSLQNNKNLEMDKGGISCTEKDVQTFQLKYLGKFQYITTSLTAYAHEISS